MHINDVFANNSKMVKYSFLLKHQVCLFNSRISKNVRVHSEISLKTSQFLLNNTLFLTMFPKMAKHRANDALVSRPTI